MAIRIVDNKGIADTQAELLASTQADNINFYCVDTGNTFTSINSNFTSAGTNLVGDIDTTANTYTNGTLLASTTISGGVNAVIDLEKLAIRIPPTLAITVGARVTSGAASSVTAALNYYEDL